MNANLTPASRAYNDAQREAENAHRALRLRRDWYIREAVRAYLAERADRGSLGLDTAPLQIEAELLLAPYLYLDHVSLSDFRWNGTPR